MENKRIQEIIRILLQQETYITIHDIAELLHVSNKTVRNDLASVAACLEEYHLFLRKKTGTGIRIEGSETHKLSLLESVSQKIQLPHSYSPPARKIYIGLRLITGTENCRIYELASELYVSRATIHKEISALSRHFESYRVQIVRKNNNGISLTGKEQHLRDLMFDLMTEDRGYADFLRIVREPSCSCHGTFPFEALDYTDCDIQKFIRLILDSGDPYVDSLPFNALISVLLRVFISLMRIMDSQLIRLSAEFMEELQAEPLYPEARRLTLSVEQDWQVTFPEEELRYLQTHLLALQNKSLSPDREQTAARELADKLLSLWERLLGLPITTDQELRESLTAHLTPAVTRIRHGISIENPMMDTIRAYYPNTLEIVRKSLGMLDEDLLSRISDDEAGYLAVHLAAALDRAKQPLKTILVCHGGVGSSRLLLRKLSTQIPEIQIIAQESFLTIQNADLSQAELIISTLELHLPIDIPILQIGILMYDHDIQRLKEIIREYYKKKNTPPDTGSVNELPQ